MVIFEVQRFLQDPGFVDMDGCAFLQDVCGFFVAWYHFNEVNNKVNIHVRLGKRLTERHFYDFTKYLFAGLDDVEIFRPFGRAYVRTLELMFSNFGKLSIREASAAVFCIPFLISMNLHNAI